MTQTYELTNNPYYRQPENVTIVTIKKEHGQRYSYEQAGLSGDRTHESQEVLIQAVLDVVKAELDPASAIVQTQAKLEEATHKLAETEAKQTATDEAVKHNQAETDRFGKISHALVLAFVTGKLLPYGTTYKILADLIPTAEIGKRYMANDLIVIEDAAHVEVDGEGKRILVQLNKEFTYNGEPASDFARNGRLEMDGTGAAWKFEPQGQNEPTTVAPAAAVSTTATVTPTVTEPSATTVTPNQ
jgi:hypothetical protein|nr:MAG TPA: Protein of unknown function (DUF1366) [Caudoviricetes sp.]